MDSKLSLAPLRCEGSFVVELPTLPIGALAEIVGALSGAVTGLDADGISVTDPGAGIVAITGRSTVGSFLGAYAGEDVEGAKVGGTVISGIGASLGQFDGVCVGSSDGEAVGHGVGAGVGNDVGNGVGGNVGDRVGGRVGLGVGNAVGDDVGDRMGPSLGSSAELSASSSVSSLPLPSSSSPASHTDSSAPSVRTQTIRRCSSRSIPARARPGDRSIPPGAPSQQSPVLRQVPHGGARRQLRTTKFHRAAKGRPT